MSNYSVLWAALLITQLIQASTADNGQVPEAFSSLKVPPGFTIEAVASTSLIERPVVGTFDDEGRLYVAESSGSNDPLEEQVLKRPHRIVRLEDTNGDGKYDRRKVFADQMMFPEGIMYFDGSLYVSGVPSIWKLTDRDGDGVADERVEWYQGKTLTGCGNDLHGPYAGPDGWIYWCKGAFAEQTHILDGHEWKTKAAHIFRARPDGSGFEPVFTAGMDNPVDLTFMADGERILAGTYFNENPRRDGLAHAVYGGVWGKEHGVLEGHARTGELMPLLTDLHAAACSGLERYDATAFGDEYSDALFLCEFNHRRVSRQRLTPEGSTYACENHNFVSSDFVDFHPTDVLVDADGSLLIIDTGGWYKLCCPTSQLWKPDVVGGIYRVRCDSATTQPTDPRGMQIEWSERTADQLWNDLADCRSLVRKRATRELVRGRESRETQTLLEWLAINKTPEGVPDLNRDSPVEGRTDGGDGAGKHAAATARAWALVQIDTDASRLLVRQLLSHNDAEIRHIALYAASLTHDAAAVPDAMRLLKSDSQANRRIAAEALGRSGDRQVVGSLLSAAAVAGDRVLQHSLIYALIEIADPAATRRGLESSAAKTISAALIALDQMPDGKIRAAEVVPCLNAENESLRQTAVWIVMHHPEWGGQLTAWLTNQLTKLPLAADGEVREQEIANCEALLEHFTGNADVQTLLANVATSGSSPLQVRALAMRVIANAQLSQPPKSWVEAESKIVSEAHAVLLPIAIDAARSVPVDAIRASELKQSLEAVADSTQFPVEVRVNALAVISSVLPRLSSAQFELLEQGLSTDNSVPMRLAAVDSMEKARLTPSQLSRLCNVIHSAGPLELNRLFAPFARTQDEQVGLQLIDSLKTATSLSAVRIDLLREALAKFDPAVQHSLNEFELLVNVDAAAQRKRIEELLPKVLKGDVRRGHAVFYSDKATCSSCHRLGNAGGTIGPDLSHVGQTRTERDLLESILYPSLSFVRSFEPVIIITMEGKVFNGVVQNETASEYVVANGPDQIVRLSKADIDEMHPSVVSIMPTGLDKQFSEQELADLIAFLKDTQNR